MKPDCSHGSQDPGTPTLSDFRGKQLKGQASIHGEGEWIVENNARIVGLRSILT